MACFYVCAALPALHLGKELPLSKDVLLTFISDQVPQLKPELEYAQRAFPYVVDSGLESSFLNSWTAYNKALRSALAFHRDISFPLPEDSLTRNFVDGFAMQRADAIPQIPNAVDQESAILFAMERGLMELEQGYSYDLENLIAYAIRIIVVEKLNAYSKANGWENFGAIQSSLIETKKEIFAGKLAVETLLQD